MNQLISNTNREDRLTEQELQQQLDEALRNCSLQEKEVVRLQRAVTTLRRRLDAAIRKIDADNDMQAKMYEELREARNLRKRNNELEQQLAEARRHYQRELLERGRKLGEATSALGIILRELLAARENSEALRRALPGDLSEPGALAKAVRTLCDIATRNAELPSHEQSDQR